MESSEALRELWSIEKPEAQASDYEEFEKRVGFLDKLAEVENSSVTVLDLCLQKYIYIRSKYIWRFDNELNDHKREDPFYYSGFIHPHDLPLVFDTYRQTFRFLYDLPVSDRKDYKLILNFRQRDKFGTYLNVILQLVVLELDKNGKIWLVLILDDILPDKISFIEVSRRLINLKTGNICLFNSESEKKILSSREIQVLGLVSKGFVSKEIADKLYLSVNTVNNHRQNILEKVNASNTSEAVSYARNLGLI
jgi:DNA-binding CsgD family transcriptional regulator